MKKKIAALVFVLLLGAVLYSGFHMLYEKFPVIGTWQYEDNDAVITFDFKAGEFSGTYENLYRSDGQYDKTFEGTYIVKNNYIHLTMTGEDEPYSIKVEYNLDGDVLTMYPDNPLYAGIAFTKVK